MHTCKSHGVRCEVSKNDPDKSKEGNLRFRFRFTWHVVYESRAALPKSRLRGRMARCSHRIAIPSPLPSPWLISRDEPSVPRLRENRKFARASISPFVPGTTFQRKGKERKRNRQTDREKEYSGVWCNEGWKDRKQ